MIKFIRRLFKPTSKTGYYFIHIPKTAGTSFINILDNITAASEIFPCQLLREINEDIISKKDSYNLIRGHFGGASYKLLSASSPHLLTILRHPQSLSISTYHFIKREPNTAVHKLVTDTKMSLKDFLQTPETLQKINNRMVRHLSFDLQQDPEAQELFLSPQSIKVVNKWIKPGKTLTNKIRLIRAKKILNKCSWFGIQEHFDRSMQLYAYTFKLPPIGLSPVLNAHNPDQILDEECIDLINEQNQYDLQLYSYALELFERRFQNMCNHLHNEFKQGEDKSLDQLIDLHYRHHSKNTPYQGVNYDFGQKLIGSGWQRREITLPEETYFRWTAQENAYIDFRLNPDEYQIKIRIINAAKQEHLDYLQIAANDTILNHCFDKDEGVVRILSATINKSIFESDILRIRFLHPRVIQHSESFGSDDNRFVGIAINWIRIFK